MLRLAASVCALTLLAVAARAGDISFNEEFALAKDRTEALKKLIPGTEDFYYYHALHHLHAGQLDKAVALFKPWFDRFHQTPRLTEIQTRHALLNYDKDPKASLEFFRNRLGLYFDHQKVVQGGVPNLPTSLDPKTVSTEALRQYSKMRWQHGTDNYEDAALDWVLAETTDPNLRRHLLNRLQRPDLPGLAKIVNDDLNHQHSGGFGSIHIHRQLTLAQMDELLKIQPGLINNQNYVFAYFTKLQPGDDEDWRRDPKLTRAYLDRLLKFARTLPASFNSLKAHVLNQRLTLDETQGAYDKDLFVEYLKLPRFQNYMSQTMLQSDRLRQHPCDLNANYLNVTLLPPIGGSDEPLVRRYLKQFLADAKSPREYEPWINDVYLRHLYAECQIELGKGEPEQHAADLPPELFRQLKDRVDIDFGLASRTNFAADEPVSIDLFVKNVPTLMVKVFEVNTQNFYRLQRREIDTGVNLDGLVANEEKSYTYTDSPFLRVNRKFEFPQINKPGVYVIDFIGAGKSSRALIRKGRMRAIAGMSTAGQKLTIIDDSNKIVPNATVWLGGQEYKAHDEGVAIVPFSTAPSRQPVILSKGDFSSLDFLEHQAENYQLTAGIHVDREALLSQKLASLVIRPSLKINGLPVSVKLLEDVRLVILATDLDGVPTSTQVTDFRLFEDRESVHDFRVPARLAALTITLHGKVKSLSRGNEVELSAQETFALNGIDRTEKIEDLHLARFGDRYVVEVLGRTGEAKPDRPVHFQFKHRQFKEQVHAVLKSDAKGRIDLGTLPEIAAVVATGPEGTSHTWTLPMDRHSYRRTVHAKAGETVAVPYLGTSDKPLRTELSLLEMRGETVYADRFDKLAIKDGMVEATGLAAGDYDLLLKELGQRIRVRIADGEVRAGHVLGTLRHLQLPGLKPAQIAGVAGDEQFVSIRLRDHSDFTRVHVYATRYLPAFSCFHDLAKVRDNELEGAFPLHTESVYLAGRNIGDEYRYVLDRRNQKKFPGNMLERPSFLLNPFVLRSTETGEQVAMGGEEYKKLLRSAGGNAIKGEPAPTTGWGVLPAGGVEVGGFADLDFLYDSSACLLNMVPDKDGVIRLRRGELGPHAMIHIVAVDPVNTTSRSAYVGEQKADFADLRLRNGLDPKRHFTQQKQATVLPPGKPLVIADAAASRFEMYDSLAKVYGLYSTLSHDPKLAEFAFLMNWPKLKQEEKQSLYSKHAGHELSFFLFKKDPAFFNAVIKPYLANKKDKTFMDRFLLGEDLGEYLHPWEHARLNSVERVLLAQTVNGERSKTARYMSDLWKLMPPDLERSRMLYETALKAGDLRGGMGDPKGGRLNVPTPVLAANAPATSPPPAAEPSVPTGGFMLGAGVTSDAGMSGKMITKSDAPASKSQMRMERDGRSSKDAKKAEESRRNADLGLDKDLSAAVEVDKESEFNVEAPQLEKEKLYFDDARGLAKSTPARLYRRVDITQELAENNYYKLPVQQQVASLVPVSGFWCDYANHDGNSPFLSRHFTDASHNFTEMMLALAVIDLPFAAGKHDAQFVDGKMTFTPGSSVLAFHEEVKPAADAADKVQILVSQNFYRQGDRYKDVDGERLDKFVTGEFVVQTVYGTQVVVTNPTPSRQRLTVLIQVPVGAIPVANGQQTKTVHLDLEPYRTQMVDFLFYFPRAGQFDVFPAHVAKGEVLVAAANPFRFNVVDKPTTLDTESWDYVSQNGTAEQVLAFLNRENIHSLDLSKIAFRMKDKSFFESAIALLKERHAYHPVLWAYGVFHNAVPVVREFFAQTDHLVNEAGGPIDSTLLTINPVVRHTYEHLEYKPLVNARAHALGNNRQIVNARFHEQYERYLKSMTYRPRLTDDDLLAASYYLLLQDRVEEAMDAFGRVDAGRIAAKMQYDYCAAYLDLFNDEPRKVRSIIAKYGNHPVERWRNAFAAIAAQLDEFDGKGPKLVDKDDQAQQQAKLAAQEPGFEFGVAGKTINLTWKNIEKVRVNYYLMDVELLFSRSPFVQQGNSQFSMIRPNETAEYKLPNFQNKLAIPLPESLHEKNVLVEIVANGKTRSVPVLANVMSVTLNENYGQLQVTDQGSGKMLPKVYVKCYARLADGTVKFHKDGYTDQRGKFDYASVSTPERQPVAKYGILVLSESKGAVIREVAPPQQ